MSETMESLHKWCVRPQLDNIKITKPCAIPTISDSMMIYIEYEILRNTIKRIKDNSTVNTII